MTHRPRPSRVLVFAALAATAFVLWHSDPNMLFSLLTAVFAGAATYEAIPGQPL